MVDQSKIKMTTVASVPRPYAVKGSPNIGLYINTPEIVDGFEFLVKLSKSFRGINASKYEKNMHAVELALPTLGEEEYGSYAETISEMCRNSGIVFIVDSYTTVAEKVKADGIIISAERDKSLENIRKKFGDDFIIGVDCKSSMSKASNYIDNKLVDYVSFDYNKRYIGKLVQFWKSNTDKPCVIKGCKNEDLCSDIVNLGADFVGCRDFIWNHPEGTEEAIKVLMKTIEETVSSRKTQ